MLKENYYISHHLNSKNDICKYANKNCPNNGMFRGASLGSQIVIIGIACIEATEASVKNFLFNF